MLPNFNVWNGEENHPENPQVFCSLKYSDKSSDNASKKEYIVHYWEITNPLDVEQEVKCKQKQREMSWSKNSNGKKN